MAKRVKKTSVVRPTVKQALVEFVGDIEATGGVFYDDNGNLYPCADPEWSDLADSYLMACVALNRKPLVAGEDG